MEPFRGIEMPSYRVPQVLAEALCGIGLNLIEAVPGTRTDPRPAIYAIRPDYVWHELAHGWECPVECINLSDFGLTDSPVFVAHARETECLGLQAGLMDHHGQRFGDDMAAPLLVCQRAVEQLIEERYHEHAPFWEAAHLSTALWTFNVPAPDQFRATFARAYARALHHGLDEPVRVWRGKLAQMRTSIDAEIVVYEKLLADVQAGPSIRSAPAEFEPHPG